MKKRIDINQKSFAFTHRYDEGKFAFEKLRNVKDAFNIKINNLNKKFSVIECVGVLHHLKDPEEGLKVLLNILEPNGYLKLGLYSDYARKHIVETRKLLKKHNFQLVVIPSMRTPVNTIHYAKEFFGNNVETKFIPHFFPFTEPSAEVLVKWQNGEWLEILGCGMVDPNVLSNVNYPESYKGFAWGVGIERLAMLRYKIDHIKNFYDNDIRFLEQF